ncbi:uncharacterized protein LOC125807261 [Solanum verrucosum]|uniref:uncharacterized protein LOC125807261 n=1 Tax=Solanum verrucosum TaxID=315347 RepID=UPI0020D056A6|nr:uncharacterized protein LOC125807261 [Solanum verrucosum]
MEDDDTLFQESKVTRDAQRSDNLKKSAFEFDKSKKVIGVPRSAQKSDTSPFESRKAKKVFEVAQGAKETETSLFEFDKAKKLVLQVCLNLEKQKKWLKWYKMLRELKLILQVHVKQKGQRM